MPSRPELQLQVDPTTPLYRTRALQLAVVEARRYQHERGITADRIAPLRQRWERYTPTTSPIGSPSITKTGPSGRWGGDGSTQPPPFTLGPATLVIGGEAAAPEARPIRVRPFLLASPTEAEAVLQDIVLLLSNSAYSLEKNYSHTVDELGKLRMWMNPYFLPGIVAPGIESQKKGGHADTSSG